MGSEAGGRMAQASVLADFVASGGELRSVAANLPVRLNESAQAWFVERGTLDIYVAEYEAGQVRSAFKHVLRLGEGRLAFGVDEREGAGSAVKLVAKGRPGTRLRRLPVRALLDESTRRTGAAGFADALVAEVDAWVDAFAAALVRDLGSRPPRALRLAPEEDLGAISTGIVSARHGVVWLRGPNLEATFLEVAEAPDAGPGLMPVTQDAWVELHGTAGVTFTRSRGLAVQTLLLHGLPEFHRLALATEDLHRRLALVDEANLQAAGMFRRRGDEAQARRDLARLSDTRRECPPADMHPLEAALNVIGAHEGIAIRFPAPRPGIGPSLDDVCDMSGVRVRRVRLAAEDRWWLGDSGAMLTFGRDDGRPLVLLPGAGGRYRLLDPVSGQCRRAGADTGEEVAGEAWLLYRTLPSHRPVRMTELFGVAGGNVALDLARLAAAGLAAGVLALAPAVAVNLAVGSVIPAGASATMLQLAAILAAIAFMAALSHMFRGTALMRLEGRAAARITAAVWDRLLRLRPGFFRGFTVGELASRAMIFQTLRDRISGAVADALLSVLFLLPMFALLFHYNTALGWLISGFGIATLAVTATLVALLVDPQRRHFDMMHRISGDLLQLLNGINKLRATGAEGSAFAVWARHYRELKLAQIRISALTEHITAFSAAIPALAATALFAVALVQGPRHLAPDDFLAVYTASMVFFAAVVMLGQSLQALASIVPGCEQVRPILMASGDPAPRSGEQVALGGAIAFHQVSFRYSEDGPMVLEDVSLHARSGELIAVVGESGVGKSTLFRLALGLEEPLTGAVYYDGKDLAHLDRTSVRRQIGVVTQDGALQGGNVLNNIIGVGQDLTVDDAWRAARQAAVDRDIAAMPMEMFTAVGERGASFSGGQSQRIRVAAALVNEPRILFLDEPTSWLDTRSQAETMRGIEESVSTRIVIAHRLSTIRKADRIYVLRAGRVAQIGPFDELIGQEGPFRDLVRRQMVSDAEEAR